MRPSLIALMIAAQPAFAQDLTCAGTSPDWALQISDDRAAFSYLYDSDLTLALTTQAEGADWPRALTFIGRGDSAILMIEPQVCTSGDMSARVLTQRGETPVLLVGCCKSDD